MLQELIADFQNEFADINFQQIIISSIAIIGGFILVQIITFRLIKYIGKKRQSKTIKGIYGKLNIPSLILMVAIALNVVLFVFAPKHQIVAYIKHSMHLILIFSLTLVIIRLIAVGRDIVLLRYDIDKKDNLKDRKVYTQFKILERILSFVVILIATAVALMTFSGIRSIGVSLFASAGVAGIILGFAAQKLIATVLAGFQIAITQPMRLGDAVIVENEWGWIDEITLTYVVVRIWDKRRLVLPTTYFIETPFQNWTRESSDILGTVFLYTDYTIPFDKIREELTRILNGTNLWDGQVNVMQVTNTTEKTVEIRVLVSAADSPTAWDLRVLVREKLIEFLQKNYPECLPQSRVIIKGMNK